MVRNYKKKTGRASYGSDHLLRALTAIQGGTPLLRVSKEFGIPARTLRRHRDKGVLTPGKISLGRYSQALPHNVEEAIHEHIKYMERALYGLTSLGLNNEFILFCNCMTKVYKL